MSIPGFCRTGNYRAVDRAMTAKNKREIHQLILNGDIDIVIGTHAIIQKDVEFKKLGFIVVDEQHRFGVAQRSTLRQKGTNPHVLAMTATPIPERSP